MSRGQTLCVIMIIAGLILFVWEYKKLKNKGIHHGSAESISEYRR